MATIVNQSRYLVTVKGRADLTREFVHAKAAQAQAYKDQVLAEHGFTAQIERGPLQLLVRLRVRGQPMQSKRVTSYEAAEAFELAAQVDQNRGLAIDYNRSHRVTMAALMTRYMAEECITHKGEDIEVSALTGMLADSRGELAAAREAFKKAKARGENPKPIKARRQARQNLEWLHLPFIEVRSEHLTAFKIARLTQVAPATVDRELDLIAAVIHTAIDQWDYDLPKDPMKGISRPRYDNERNRRFEGDEQERLFRSARREDLIRSRKLAIEALMAEPRQRAKRLPNASARQRFLKKARGVALKQLKRRYPVVPLYESLIAFLLETAGRRGETLALRWKDVKFSDQTAFFRKTKNGFARTVPVQRFSLQMLEVLPREDVRVFPLTVGGFKGAWERIAERAGLRERDRKNKEQCANDFHPHDLRHEGLSRIAEAGFAKDQNFSVLDLQAISGHLDITSLTRYVKVSPKNLVKRLNAVFADAGIAPDGGHRARSSRARSPRPPERAPDNVIPFEASHARRLMR